MSVFNRKSGIMKRRKEIARAAVSAIAAVSIQGMASSAQAEEINATSVTNESCANELIIEEKSYSVNGKEYSYTLDGLASGFVYGGLSEEENASDNKITIADKAVKVIGNGYIYGGKSVKADANNNTIDISDGTVIRYIHGGDTSDGTVTNNVVNISGGNISGDWISGAHVSGSGTADSNVTEITGGVIGVSYIEGSWGKGNHRDNKVNIRGGEIDGGIISGTWVSSDTAATGNETNISGGTVKNATISGAYFATDTGGIAAYNVVNISGNPSISNSTIYGGRAPYGSSIDNIVNIYDNPDLSTSSIYGRMTDDSGNSSGNTLNIYTKDINLKNIYNFDSVNFFLPESVINGSTILTLIDGMTDLSGVTIKAGVQGNASLIEGDTITLLTNANGIITDNATVYGSLSEGISLDYPLTVSQADDYSIKAVVGTVYSHNLASGNNVTMTDHSYTINGITTYFDGSADNVYGGIAASDFTINNTIVGGKSTSGDASNNAVTINSGSVGNVYGGYTVDGSASSNVITINGGVFLGEIYGGYTDDETAKANKNTINLYNIPDLRLAYLRGGMAGNTFSSDGNVLNIYTQDILAKNISGFEKINFYIPATAKNADIMLTLTEGATDLKGMTICAGIPGNSNLSQGGMVTLLTNVNGLLMDDQTKFGKLSEGVSLEYELTISRLGEDSVIATIANAPYSPEPESGTNSDGTLKFDTPSLSPASIAKRTYADNVVNIDHAHGNYDVNGKRVTYDEAAAYISETSGPEDVLNNAVNVSSGTFTQKVWGAASDSGAVRYNKLTVTGGNYAAGLLGAWSNSGDITENTLSLSNVDITGAATGAWSNNGDVTVNKFIIDSGRLQGDVTGARSESGNVSGNILTINGGHITGDVFGGWSTTGEAHNNTININGGIIDCFIVGGVTADGNSTGNTMSIAGRPDLTDAYLVGSAATGTYDTIPVSSGYTGHDNTLNIHTIGLSVKNIAEFDTLNFYLPATARNGDTALTLTSGTTSLEGMNIRAGLVGNSSLTTGDTVTLLANSNGLANGSTKYEKLSEGVSLDYDLTFTNTDNKINMTVQNPIATSTGNALKPQTAAIEQAAAVPAVRLMNSVVDLGSNWWLADNSESENKDVAGQQVDMANEFRIFGNMGASSIRTKTDDGGSVDNKNWGMDIGWAKEVDYSGSKLFFAPIVDYGRAQYKSHIAGVQGSGSTNYLAGGIIARKMYDSGFYIEGSFRYGRMQMDFASNDFEMMGEKVHVSYDATTPCWAGHLHIGKILKIDRQSSLNIYGMYHHAHQGGMTANLSTGETYTFDAVDSGRLRVGARITRQAKKNQRFYSGLIYQYEFSGSARAHYKDYVTPDTSTSGSSAMVELGWQYQPVRRVPWLVDVNVSGCVGKQEGIKAGITIKKSF